jgi:hypothetical protein
VSDRSYAVPRVGRLGSRFVTGTLGSKGGGGPRACSAGACCEKEVNHSEVSDLLVAALQGVW